MDVIAITNDRQTDQAIDALSSHGISWSYVTPGMSIEPAGLLELAAETTSTAMYACEEANDAESQSERETLRSMAAELRRIAHRLADLSEDAAGAAATCDACDNDGWLYMATDGDDSRAWIERCDNCALFEDDDQAAKQASIDTGRWIGWASPADHDDVHPFLVNL